MNIITISGNSKTVVIATICELEMDRGTCKAIKKRYYFNKSSGMCEKFIYGGCEGNQNNFRTIGECKRTCEGTFLYRLYSSFVISKHLMISRNFKK